MWWNWLAFLLLLISHRLLLIVLPSDHVQPSMQLLSLPFPFFVKARTLTQTFGTTGDISNENWVWFTSTVSESKMDSVLSLKISNLYPRIIPFSWSGGTDCQLTENAVEFKGAVVTFIGAQLGTKRNKQKNKLKAQKQTEKLKRGVNVNNTQSFLVH